MPARMLLSLLLLITAACTTTTPASNHQFEEAPLRLARMETISRTRSVFVSVPPEELLAWIIDVPLEDVFGQYGTIPAVAGTAAISPSWGDAGSSRRVLLADGHQAAEQILSVEPGVAFTYQVWGFTNTAGRLASYAIGSFEVSPAMEGSDLTWTYTFAPRSAWTRLPLTAFVTAQWSGYMSAATERLKRGAERDIPTEYQ